MRQFLFGSLGGLAAATCGCLLALALGRFVVMETVQADLATYATRLIEAGEAASDETGRVLREVNASPYPFCSDAEIDMLRGLAFRSRQIEDVGRLRAGVLYCSGVLGRLARPLPASQSTLLAGNGLKVHPGVQMAFSPEVYATVIESGGANVVMSAEVYSGWVPPPYRYTVAIVNEAEGKVSGNWGEPLAMPATAVLAHRTMEVDGVLHRSVCSRVAPLCAVTGIALADVWGEHRSLLWIAGVAGALLGLFAGIAALLLWRRGQSLESHLRRAIRRGGLTVAYQPIVDLQGGRVTGAEALVRWRHEQGRSVSAEIFVKLAEDRGFIDQITRFVLRNALHEMSELLHRRLDFRLNINVAPSDVVDEWLVDELETRMSVAGVAPAQIGLELTERSTADRAVAAEAIARLRAKGHAVYIDDFGTGYSNLSYLTELGVDGLKIDRSFTRRIGTDSATSIVPQIVEMARTLRMGVVVEGIETEVQYEYFRGLGGGIRGQGRYFGHPMAAREFLAWLAHREA